MITLKQSMITHATEPNPTVLSSLGAYSLAPAHRRTFQIVCSDAEVQLRSP